MSLKLEPHRGERGHGKGVDGELVVADGDAAEVLQLGEEPLDEFALAMEACSTTS